MRTSLLSLALVATLATACASEGGSAGEATAGSNRPTATAEPTEAAVEEPTDEPVEEPADAGPGIIAFAETFTFDDGLSITVEAPRPYQPSESASLTEGFASTVTFDITIVNGTQAAFDPSSFTTTMQSGNVEASEIFDSANNVGGAPSTTLLPGREAKFSQAYALNDPADIVLEVSPSFEHENYIVTNAS